PPVLRHGGVPAMAAGPHPAAVRHAGRGHLGGHDGAGRHRRLGRVLPGDPPDQRPPAGRLPARPVPVPPASPPRPPPNRRPPAPPPATTPAPPPTTPSSSTPPAGQTSARAAPRMPATTPLGADATVSALVGTELAQVQSGHLTPAKAWSRLRQATTPSP